VCDLSRGWGEWGCAYEWWSFKKDIKALIREYGMVIVQVVVGGVLSIYMESLDCVEVCSFAMVFQHLHCIVNGAKGVVVFDKMLGKFGRMAVGSQCVFVFIKPYCKAPASLTHIRFLTIGAHESIYS
jgi:hypothetical protein